jgi:hemerythrin superfamily protein
MDVFEILKKDHQRVRELFARMMQTARRDRTIRHNLFVELKRELLAHERAEERALCPKLADEDKTRDLIEEAEQVFPKAQSILPRDQFDPLGRQVRWAEKKEKKRTAG